MALSMSLYIQYYDYVIQITDFIIMPKNNNISKEISITSSFKLIIKISICRLGTDRCDIKMLFFVEFGLILVNLLIFLEICPPLLLLYRIPVVPVTRSVRKVVPSHNYMSPLSLSLSLSLSCHFIHSIAAFE